MVFITTRSSFVCRFLWGIFLGQQTCFYQQMSLQMPSKCCSCQHSFQFCASLLLSPLDGAHFCFNNNCICFARPSRWPGPMTYYVHCLYSAVPYAMHTSSVFGTVQYLYQVAATWTPISGNPPGPSMTSNLSFRIPTPYQHEHKLLHFWTLDAIFSV